MTDRLDIALHTAPTVITGGLMGFMAGWALSQPLSFTTGLLIASAVIGMAGFSYLWSPRERSQHGGKIKSWQSRLEAFVPLAAGPLAFAASTFVFWKWPI